MKKLSDWLFDIGFFPILHEAVKHDFLSWYYEASQADKLTKNVDLDNSELTYLTNQARKEAENFDQNSQLIELIEMFEELKTKIDTSVHYIAAIAMVIGGGFSAAAVFQVRDLVYAWVIGGFGSLFFISGVGIILVYKILVHQLKTNSELVTNLNKELVEKPGDVRRNDQDWNQLAAQFFWNKSLLSPKTHICLMILSIIRILNIRVYGFVCGDLRENIRGFVGMDTVDVVSHQLTRLRQGDLPSQYNH